MEGRGSTRRSTTERAERHQPSHPITMKPSTNFCAAWRGLATTIALSGLASAQVTTDWLVDTRGVSIAVDREDNVFTLDYEQQLGAEMVVTKRAPDGSLLWTASFDQTDFTKWERAQWIATDSQGAVIVCGTLMSGFSNPVVAASIALKFDAAGNFQWRHVGGNGFDGSSTVRCLVDRDDNAYVVGVGQSGTGLVSKIEKFAPNGVSQWSWFDTAGIGRPIQFKLTPDDHLLVTGRALIGSLNGHAKVRLDGTTVWAQGGIASFTVGDCAGDAFGNTYIVRAGGLGTIVEKRDPLGAVLWTSSQLGAAQRVEVGPDDLPVAAGFPNVSTAGAAFFKVDAAGNLVWSNLDADGPFQLLLHAQLVLDGSGDAYLGAGTLFDQAVCKVGADGASQWVSTTPGAFTQAFALSRASNGVFVVGGRTSHILDAGEGTWAELTDGLAGVDGTPRLDGEGTFALGSDVALHATHAPAGTFTVHVMGVSALNLPILGGTLVPSPDLFWYATSDSVGRSTLLGTIGTSFLPGAQFWFQTWFLDPAAVQSFSATNAVRVTVG
jgi:hypothetical protein